MKIQIASCLLILALLPACTTTQAVKTGTLEERMLQQVASVDTGEPVPPAEGPEDVPPDAPSDVNRNPALVPSPLLRLSAASSTP